MTHFVRFRKSSEYIRFEVPPLEMAGCAFLPSTAYVPLLQHTGSRARPVVAIGDAVHEGQLIARGMSGDSSHIHSPIPGIVREFRTIPMPDGTMEQSAVVTLSGSFDILGRKEENYPWKNVSESEILRVLEDKGLINTFETPISLVTQLREAKKVKKPILALRLFDGDPTCLLDSFMVKHALDRILEGCAIIARAIDAKAAYLVHIDRRWDGPDDRALAEIFQERHVAVVRSSGRYPSGNTGQFLDLLRGLQPDYDAKSIVLIDPITAYSAYEAVVKNVPILNRFIAITGPALESPAVLKVRVGTPIGDIIEERGGFKADPSRIVVNGLLRGQAVYDLDTPITKYTKSLHIMDADTCKPYTVRDCVHCGRCLQVCPVSIDPQRIATIVMKDSVNQKLLDSMDACQYCGCCAIVCPSRIPLHHIIREATSRRGGIAPKGTAK